MNASAETRAFPSVALIDRFGSDRTLLLTVHDIDEDAGKRFDTPQLVLVFASRETFRDKLEQARSRSEQPILLVLPESDATDRVSALEAGADDIVSETIAPGELIARLRALLRRSVRRPEDAMRVGDVEIDVAQRRVRRGEREIDLSRIEMELLLALARRRGGVVGHRTLMREVWGATRTMASVHTSVCYLRAKLETAGEAPLVRSVRGIGYALRDDGLRKPRAS